MVYNNNLQPRNSGSLKEYLTKIPRIIKNMAHYFEGKLEPIIRNPRTQRLVGGTLIATSPITSVGLILYTGLGSVAGSVTALQTIAGTELMYYRCKLS